MLFEWIDTEIPVQTFHLAFGAFLGVLFGVAAQISKFCLRRAVAGDNGTDWSAAAVWLTALVTAIGSFQLAAFLGWIELSEHRLLSTDLPIAAIILGGLMFGAGMVLTRGCVSRLTVLMASGNLRALMVLAVFAVAAHAAIKGILAPLRVALGSFTVPLPFASFSEMTGASIVIPVILLVILVQIIRANHAHLSQLGFGAVIGLLVTIGWFGTQTLLADEFDPLPVQSLAFTLPWTETLFWVIASSAIPAGFGTGLIAGVIIGAGTSALLRREFAFQSFTNAPETGRYLFGGTLMGVGGVLTGGCTVGAGLSGTSMLSIAAFIALGSIIAGAVLTQIAMQTQPKVLAA